MHSHKRVEFKILVFILGVCSVLVGCKEDPPTSNQASVAFAPYIENSLSYPDARDYAPEDLHWKYYCSSTKSAATADESEWLDFTGVDKGLGVIEGLDRAGSYYFGLRAYLANSDYAPEDLFAEGYNETVVTFTSKRTLVSIAMDWKKR